MNNGTYHRWHDAIAAGLRTRTQWTELGQAVLADARPGATFSGYYDDYDLYPESATRPKRRVASHPPKKIDLLHAIFAVTRAAKRFRDAASSCYDRNAHGFAGTNRARKKELNELKDRGIVAAVAAGRIAPVAARGNLTEYRGEGYCYHSLLRPVDWSVLGAPNESEPLTVEAKPRTSHEPRLKDAIFTLAELPSDQMGFIRIPFAPRMKTCAATASQFDSSWGDDDEGD